LKIAVIQINASDDPAGNLDKVLSFLERASLNKPDVIVLPEYSNYMGPLSSAFEKGEEENGPWFKALARFAGENDTHVIAGLLLKGENGKAYSTLLSFDGTGRLVSRYRKLHLFDVDLPEGPRIRESDHLIQGTSCVTGAVAGVHAGFAICYDIRFPELFRRLKAMSAKAFFTVSAFTETTGKAHWEILLRARAIENQAYLIAANQVGPCRPDKSSYGHSMIVDPWGNIVCQAPGPGSPQAESVIFCDLDPSLVDRTERQMPCGTHVRRDLFTL
jgi:deaminated glutathione amidase